MLVRIVDPLGELYDKSDVTVGLRLRIEEEYSDRSAYVDVDEAEGLLASLQLLASDGADLLTSPLVEGITDTERSSEVHYTTKEKTILAAFEDRRGNLRFAIKIRAGADWAYLVPAGVGVLESNLSSGYRRRAPRSNGVDRTVPAGGLGQGLKCLIDRPFTDDETNALLA